MFPSGPCVDGPIGRLQNDIVDEDLKGLATWLHKHIRYAELEAERRGRPVSIFLKGCTESVAAIAPTLGRWLEHCLRM